MEMTGFATQDTPGDGVPRGNVPLPKLAALPNPPPLFQTTQVLFTETHKLLQSCVPETILYCCNSLPHSDLLSIIWQQSEMAFLGFHPLLPRKRNKKSLGTPRRLTASPSPPPHLPLSTWKRRTPRPCPAAESRRHDRPAPAPRTARRAPRTPRRPPRTARRPAPGPSPATARAPARAAALGRPLAAAAGRPAALPAGASRSRAPAAGGAGEAVAASTRVARRPPQQNPLSRPRGWRCRRRAAARRREG